MNKDLTVILPAYNEEQTIGRVIDEIRALPMECEILVMDNASTDETCNIATYKADIVATEPIQGKGNAMRRGFKLARTPYVIMMDSDYTYPAKSIPAIHTLLSGKFDVVIGYRHWREDGAMTSVNTLGNKMLSLLASVLYRKRVHDVCSGLWGFRRDALDKLCLNSGGFTLEAELLTEVVRHRCKLIQIPTGYRSRPDGSVAKLRVWDGIKIGWCLVKGKWKR